MRPALRECAEHGPRGAIRPRARQSVEGVGDEHDSSGQRNRVAAETVRIAVAVDSLVTGARALADERMQVELREDVVRDHGVRLDQLPLVLGEFSRLAQDRTPASTRAVVMLGWMWAGRDRTAGRGRV